MPEGDEVEIDDAIFEDDEGERECPLDELKQYQVPDFSTPEVHECPPYPLPQAAVQERVFTLRVVLLFWYAAVFVHPL